MSNRPSSTSDAATRLTVWPISSAISCAVSASITSVILCIAPCFISSRMTSTARSDMRLASSWILMASGITTSRTSFSFGSFDACPFRRWVRRRNEAIERSRTSSALSAVTSVRRPRCFCGAGFAVGFGGDHGADGATGAAADLARTFILVGDIGGDAGGARGGHRGAGRGGCGAALASASPKRFLASSSALRLASSSWRWRSSSALRRASAASRSACSMPSLLLRRLASSSARRRSSTSRTLASASALARAERSSSVRVRSTTPELLRGAAGGGAGRVGGALAGAGAALAATGSGACGSVAGASPPTRRLPRFSTTTCLVRPWLKLWRTVPVSTRGLSVKVLVGTLSVLSPGVLVSTIQQSQSCLSRACPHSLYRRILGRIAGCLVVIRHPVSDQDMAARQERLARRAREQRSMYHI